MPLYEYRCTSCGYSFEKIQSFSAEPESVCPKCQGVLIRPVTAPALRFEGAGWYVNDYAGKGSAKAAENSPDGLAAKETKTESKPGDGSTPAASATPTAATAAASSAPSTPATSSSGS